jgi:choline kinase
MKVIILAAGQGTRLRPLTNNRPKCMVEVNGKPLIKHQLDLFFKKNIQNINVITGYLGEKINFPEITKYYNPKFKTTNMVSTLFCANNIFDGTDDILISYGDIIYNNVVLDKIIMSNNEINVVVDTNWKSYWAARMDNPLQDAETLKIGKRGNIIELGKKPTSYDQIEGQYIGLIKIRADVAPKIKEYYNSLDKNALYDGQDYDNMYMTSFLQMIANNLYDLTPTYINSGWIEVDEPSDLNHTSFLNN